MEWLKWLFVVSDSPSFKVVPYIAIIIAIVAAVGHMIGSLKIKGLGLGVAGVLFAGLIYAHFWMKPGVDHKVIEKQKEIKEILEFVREFGLILFVYTIGVQVGPGFIASLRRNGLKLNLMAAAIVLLGVGTTLGIYYTRMPNDLPYAVGLYSGAVTNTPSLAASQGALKEIKSLTPEERAKKDPAISYAIAYPFGVLGIIITMQGQP
jgi:putative transport protein